MTDSGIYPIPIPSDPPITSGEEHSEKTGEFKVSPDPRIAVVIPAQNNELSIGSLVLLARQYTPHVIVVDDNSYDNTATVSEHAGATVINAREYDEGRVFSILAGCRRALGYGCTVVILIDSSGKHLTRDIPAIAEPVLNGSTDLVIGSRYLKGRRVIPPFRFNNGVKEGKLEKSQHEFRSTDPESTFRALSVKGVMLLDLLPNNEQFDSLMVTLFSRKGLSVQDMAITRRKDLTAAAECDAKVCLYRGSKIGVVVPAYNEERLIGDTLAGIPEFVCRVYVVNDCSKDRTQEVVEYYAKNDPSIVPITHEVNQGVGAAIVTGYKKALEDKMDYVAVMAGDNQMDPRFLPELLDPVVEQRCDYTMGNRLINQEFRKGMSKWRYLGNSVLTMLTKIASGYWQMMDPQNGYTVISRRALERISLTGIYPRYGYCNDVLVKLNVLGFRVINVPHPARYGMEKSKIKYSTYIYRVSWLLLKDFLWRLKMKYIVLNFHPLVFFYVAGAVFTGIGIIGGLYTLYYKYILDYAMFVPLTVSLLMFGFGLQMLFFAMFYDMEQEKMPNGWYQ
ncbi:glycosyltransferase family 2 protein [Methanoregula sp.]|uniref:glycosyltransferase family 2 protein n=1 Tax=Methanoregula sp. TaxID=2052170 RepID=UPI0026267C90|nr:glycosyltransferase family 2 protein [Methanoregula sp.]MDD5141893.1 glycosyltransferase family 2 protein [Methanoregula sp.]